MRNVPTRTIRRPGCLLGLSVRKVGASDPSLCLAVALDADGRNVTLGECRY
jgi:hypothetical protein